MYVWWILTLLIGSLGGVLLFRLHIPSGMMVGAVVAVAIFSLTTGQAYVPYEFKTVAQMIVGGYVGAGIRREDIKKLPLVIKPYCLIMGIFFALNMLMGFIVYSITDMDLLTALMCTMPGGFSDSPFIAMEIGADVVKVTLMQFARMLFGVSMLPSILVIIDSIGAKREGREAVRMHAGTHRKKAGSENEGIKPVIILLVFTACFGIIGGKTKIPAGTFIISMLGAMFVKLVYTRAYLPIGFRRLAQLATGSVIGSQVTNKDIVEMKNLLLPIVLVLCAYVINCVATGHLLHKLFGINKLESMFCVSPAGAVETSLIVADLGMECPNLIVIQLMRLIGVLSIFPQLFLLVVSAFGQ